MQFSLSLRVILVALHFLVLTMALPNAERVMEDMRPLMVSVSCHLLLSLVALMFGYSIPCFSGTYTLVCVPTAKPTYSHHHYVVSSTNAISFFMLTRLCRPFDFTSKLLSTCVLTCFVQHDTSYNCKPHCDVKIKCEPRSTPNTDCLGNEEPTVSTTAKPMIPGKIEAGEGHGGRRKKAKLRLGMRWASTGNLRGVVG